MPDTKTASSLPRRTLRCVRRSLFSRTREISDGDDVVAVLHPRFFGWSSEALIDGVGHGLRAGGFFRANFTLEAGGREVARVTKSKDAKDRYAFVSEGHESLAVAPEGFFRPRYRLLDGEQEVGSVATTSFKKGTLAADLPADLPDPLAVFILFVCLEIRQAQHNSGS